MKYFWEVVIDDSKNILEVVGKSSDDTLLINNIVEMQNVGMRVRCTTLDSEPTNKNDLISGYRNERGLYHSLLRDYEDKTGKRLWSQEN